MQKNLTHKVALITGSSRGMGRTMALRLASQGADVIVNYRSNEDKANEVVNSIRKAGGTAYALQGDMSNVQSINNFYANLDSLLQEKLGKTGIDILILNAGVLHTATIQETDEAAFDKLFDVNVKGVFFTAQQAIDRLRDGGRIITFSSGLSRFSVPVYIAYSATKGAVDVMTRVLAQELGPRNITVNAIAPGPVQTDMLADVLEDEASAQHLASAAALGRVGQPNDIADVAAFLASDDSRWITGQRIEASGGMNL